MGSFIPTRLSRSVVVVHKPIWLIRFWISVSARVLTMQSDDTVTVRVFLRLSSRLHRKIGLSAALVRQLKYSKMTCDR